MEIRLFLLPLPSSRSLPVSEFAYAHCHAYVIARLHIPHIPRERWGRRKRKRVLGDRSQERRGEEKLLPPSIAVGEDIQQGVGRKRRRRRNGIKVPLQTPPRPLRPLPRLMPVFVGGRG